MRYGLASPRKLADLQRHVALQVFIHRTKYRSHTAVPDDFGDAVMIDIEAANRDVTLFGAAVEAFNPHRQVADKVPPFGITFGVGIHTCVGRELAAGVLPKEGEDAKAPRFPGIVALLVQGLLDKGVVPDPAQLPEVDSGTARQHWATYPVIFDENNKERI